MERTHQIEIKNTPQIPELSFRYYQGKSDHPVLIDLYNAINEHANIDERETQKNFDAIYANLRNCKPQEDMILAEVGGKLAASGRVSWSEEMEGDYIYSTRNDTHPDWLNSSLQDAIQTWTEGRGREISAGHPVEADKYFESWVSETQTAKIAMLRRFGFFEERYFFEMFRRLSDFVPAAKLPDGLEVRPVTPDHYRPIWDALNEAFRDHWGHVEGTEDDFQRWLKRIGEIDGYAPELWKVAWEGDMVAGMVLNGVFEEENQALGIKRGWTDPICVRRHWRKLGLATALIYQSLAMFKEMGMSQGALGVDTINPSGALKLYQNCGYVSHQQWMAFRKPF